MHDPVFSSLLMEPKRSPSNYDKIFYEFCICLKHGLNKEMPVNNPIHSGVDTSNILEPVRLIRYRGAYIRVRRLETQPFFSNDHSL